MATFAFSSRVWSIEEIEAAGAAVLAGCMDIIGHKPDCLTVARYLSRQKYCYDHIKRLEDARNYLVSLLGYIHSKTT